LLSRDRNYFQALIYFAEGTPISYFPQDEFAENRQLARLLQNAPEIVLNSLMLTGMAGGPDLLEWPVFYRLKVIVSPSTTAKHSGSGLNQFAYVLSLNT
jgi:hypothetical protein